MKYRALALIIISVITTLTLTAQQNVLDRAVGFYKQGNEKAAIEVLEDAVKGSLATNPEAWNTLGLAYLGVQAPKKARSALEKAVELKPSSSTYYANLSYAYLMTRQLDKFETASSMALKLDPKNGFAKYVVAVRHYWNGNLDDALAQTDSSLSSNRTFVPAYLLKSDILMAKFGRRLKEGSRIVAEIDLLRQAVEALETGHKQSTNDADRNLIAAELESFRWFYDHYSRRNSDGKLIPPGSPPEPGTKPYKIKKQRPGQYTPMAREAGVSGDVRLVIHLGANGKVLHVLKLWGIGYGLDEEAIKAARAIKFEPKTVNGVPVSAVIIREYTFRVY